MKFRFLVLLPLCLTANPTGHNVVSGDAHFLLNGKELSIVASDKAVLEWQDFSIGIDERTQFIQQNDRSTVLNRVISRDPSSIQGMLEANGRVILINRNGIVIGKDAVINTADFIAATSEVVNLEDWSIDPDQINSAVHLQGGAINHDGLIHANGVESSDGKIMLVAKEVYVKGTLEAPKGMVSLSGEKVILDEEAMINVSSSFGGGNVYVGHENVETTFVGSNASIHADAYLDGDGGKIIFMSDASTEFYGTATATSGKNSGDGGFIEISSLNLLTTSSKKLDASSSMGESGTILFDPCSVQISGISSGSPFTFPVYTPTISPSGILAVGDVQAALAGGNNVTIDTSFPAGGTGTVFWAPGFPIAWGTGASLTIIGLNFVTLTSDIIANGGGDITISAAADLSFFPFGPAGTVDLISRGGVITLSAGNDVNINSFTSGQSGTVQAREVYITAGNDFRIIAFGGSAFVQTNGFGTSPAPIVIDAGNDAIIDRRASLRTDNGPVFVKADRNIEMRANSSIRYQITGPALPPAPITLVVDDQAPTSPQVGDGAFIMDPTANILNINPNLRTVPVQIFTALRNQNMINGFIFGTNFSAGAYGVDTNIEHWNVYWPDPFLNLSSPFFTIFYKEPIPEIVAVVSQTIGQAFIVLEEFAYPPPPHEDFFCINRCPRAVRGIPPKRVCPWISINSYRKFYPNRQKFGKVSHTDDPEFDVRCKY